MSPEPAPSATAVHPVPRPTVLVVGFDGSDDSQAALDWAARRAHATGDLIEVVVARGAPGQGDRWLDEWSAGMSLGWAARAEDQLTRWPDLDASVHQVDAAPAPALIDRSAHASTLVVGFRGGEQQPGHAPGSVARLALLHAGGDVVVVREPEEEVSDVVAVGVDGSPNGFAALAWAAAHAHALGSSVMVVHAADPHIPRSEPELGAHLPVLVERDDAVRAAIRDTHARYPGLPIYLDEHDDGPGYALRKTSEHVRLVVVGATGNGRFTGMLLGSVPTHLLERSHCSIAVIRSASSGEGPLPAYPVERITA